jgi:4-hydroxy-tetrahydrodipicolinate reductase
LQKLLQAKSGVSLRLVPNFSIGAILMMRFAKAATKFYESAEIPQALKLSPDSAKRGRLNRSYY